MRVRRAVGGRFGGPAALCAAVALQLGVPYSAKAQQTALNRVNEQINAIGVKLETLLSEYQDVSLENQASFSDRLTDAEIMYLLGDYGRAAVVLMDLVGRPSNQSKSLYDKAMFYLAESLYQIGNNLSARDYFIRLIETNSAAYARPSIRRLIQISDRLERWEGVEDLVQAFAADGQLPADVAYIYGKSLLLQKEPKRAKAIAQQVNREHPLYLKARYLIGVAELEMGHYDAAKRIFESLKRMRGDFKDAQRVRDLAAMNTGRILLEQEQLPQSIDAYQYVDRSSALFEEALYEVTWTFVRAADAAQQPQEKTREYEKAIDALEILLLSETDNKLAPDAQLLLGNILLKLDRFDEATKAFRRVVGQYRPLRDQLRELSHQVDDPREYYEEVAERSKKGKGLLPPVALKWASGQKRLDKAMSVVEDLDQSDAWIQDSETIVSELLAVLDSNKKAQFFPALREAHTRYFALNNSIKRARQQLLGVERIVLDSALTAAEQQELEKILAERQEIEPAYRALPQQEEDYEGQLERMHGRVEKLQQTAYQLRYPIQAMRNEVVAMRRWIGNNREELTDEQHATFTKRLDQQEAEIEQLQGKQDRLEKEIAKEKNLISVTNQQRTEDARVRARYDATIEREREILNAASSRADRLERRFLEEVDAAEQTLLQYRAELERFKSSLDGVVEEKAAEIKAEILREQSELDHYQRLVSEARGNAKHVIGRIAASSMSAVEDKFHDIVLRADVGIIDVAWQKKEALTHQISRRVNQQRRELKVLDAEFKEVLGD